MEHKKKSNEANHKIVPVCLFHLWPCHFPRVNMSDCGSSRKLSLSLYIIMAHCFMFWKNSDLFLSWCHSSLSLHRPTQCMCVYAFSGFYLSFHSRLVCIATGKWNKLNDKNEMIERETFHFVWMFLIDLFIDSNVFYAIVGILSCLILSFFLFIFQPHRCISFFWLPFFGLTRWHSTYTGHFGKIS